MNKYPFRSSRSLAILSRLLLDPTDDTAIVQEVNGIGPQETENLLAIANSHHVVVRALRRFAELSSSTANAIGTTWAEEAVNRERKRIANALSFLRTICVELEQAGCNPIVIKSLDHWPDLGSDLDLYANGDPANVVQVMQQRFQAQLAERSWGDRLANKWNFIIPDLPELVEVHIGRLGQTGEQVQLASSLVARSREIKIENDIFRVPAAQDRLMICTLQRMYRHFYVRLCDIVDTATLLETEPVDYEALASSAQTAGIWEGVATFLTIVSDYVTAYRGHGIALPRSVSSASRFGGDQIQFGNGFLRVPILPHSAKLYASELTKLLLKGDLSNTARLSLLPGLATAAAIGQKMTGTDKGIW